MSLVDFGSSDDEGSLLRTFFRFFKLLSSQALSMSEILVSHLLQHSLHISHDLPELLRGCHVGGIRGADLAKLMDQTCKIARM